MSHLQCVVMATHGVAERGDYSYQKKKKLLLDCKQNQDKTTPKFLMHFSSFIL